MSFSASDTGISVGGIGGVSVVGDAGIGGGHVAGTVGVGDVLAFTGSGPGTLPLAILGAVSVVGGLFAAAFGRRRKDGPEAPVNGLADLSPLATTARPPARRRG